MKNFLLLSLLILASLGVALSQTPNNARMLSTPNAQTGTTYTFVAADATRLTTFNNAGAVAATLPNGATVGFGPGTLYSVANLGAGAVTITCTSCTISANGVAAATLVLSQGQGADIYGGIGSPAVNYVALASPAGANIAILNTPNTFTADMTVTQPCRVGTTLYVYTGCWSGSDIGAQINTADAFSNSNSLNATIQLPGGPCSSYSTPINVQFSSVKGSSGLIGTCLQYTPSTGTAFTFASGNNALLREVNITTNAVGSTAIGLAATGNSELIEDSSVSNFGTGVTANTFGIKFSHFNEFACSNAASSTAFKALTGADDVLFSDSQLESCNTLVDDTATGIGPIFFTNVVLGSQSPITSTTFMNVKTQVFGTHVHFVNQLSSAPTWLNISGGGIVNLTNSKFEDDRASGSTTSEVSITGAGSLLDMVNDDFSTAGETTTEFALCSGGGTVLAVGLTNNFPALLQSGCGANQFGQNGILQAGASAPTGLAGSGNLWFDSGSLRWKLNNNNFGAQTVAVTVSDVFTSPTINLLTNGTGVQIFNTTTTCTTAASVGATCTTAAISLPVAEADTSYRVVATCKGPTAVPVVSSTANSSATQFTITIAALTAVAASCSSFDVTVGHN